MRRQAIVLLTMTWLLVGMASPGARAWAASNVQQDGSKLRLMGKNLGAGAAAAPVPVAAPEETSDPNALPASSSGPLLVSNISCDQHESGETFVNVSASRSATYHVMMFPNPPRLVVDFKDAHNVSGEKSYAADTPVLKRVRIAQFREKDPSIVRVVADLDGNPVFDVHATAAGVRIELRPRVGTSAPSAPPVPTVKAEALKTVAAAAIALAPSVASPSSAPAPITVVTSPKAEVAPPLSAERRDVKPDFQSTLPITASSQALAAPLPLPANSTPEAMRAESAAQTLADDKDASPAAAQVTAPANPLGPSEQTKPVYTGEPISLNLKDVDLKDFFRLVHEISGLNIIVDPNVNGTVTMVLDSVPWDQALDIVLKDNELGKVLEGNVLRIARLQTLTAEQETQTRLAAARIDAAPLVTLFRPLNYAKAQDVQALLKTWVGGGALSRRGVVVIDVRSNTVIISDVQSQMPTIENIISKVDRKAKQISIEARVVLATAEFARTLASSLLGGYVNKSTVTTGDTGSSSTSITIPTPTAAQPFPVTAATSATSSGFGVASVVNVGAHYFIDATIAAAEERDQAKTISRPSIVTQNNLVGKVQQGVQVPIQTTINNTISVQYYPATLQLTVTPQVTEDNNIFMLIDVQNNSIGASISGIGPEIATQQATTSVLVPDGGTVVFGGITVTSRAKSATYIPLLGSIPVLGHLFKNSNVTDQDQELLFFVSPKILVT